METAALDARWAEDEKQPDVMEMTGREALRSLNRSLLSPQSGLVPWGAEQLPHSFSSPLLEEEELRSIPSAKASDPHYDLKDVIVEGSDGLGKHANHTGLHSGGGPSSQEDSRLLPNDWPAPVQAEARRRLLTGMQRYFVTKRAEGLLGAESLRRLLFALDLAADQADQPLSVWPSLEAGLVGGWTARMLSRAFFISKRATGAIPRILRPVLLPPSRWLSGFLGARLSRLMLVACECGVELALALAHCPAALWLREAEHAGSLRAEIAVEVARATQFVIDREIEAPQRFQAIQTHRAVMAVLRAQTGFVGQLTSSGVLDTAEKEQMEAPIIRRIRRLEIRGPVWQAPSVRQLLRALPFLHHAPENVLEIILERGSLCRKFISFHLLLATP
jgi:hypothetical protein